MRDALAPYDSQEVDRLDKVQILSIVPADGWYAVYANVPEEGPESRSRLLCWALVEAQGGERSIVGVDTDQRGTVEIAAYANNFVRYEYAVTQGSKAESHT
jgi:hypothetical protein